MLSAKVVRDAIDRMSILRFFPAEAVGVAELLNEMCSTNEQVAWLARRTTQLYDEWPGPHMLRSILCSKYPPADGIDAAGFDQRHPEGIPGESAGTAPILSAGRETLQLDGERPPISADPELTTTLEAAYQAMTGRNLARDRHRRAEEPPPIALPAPCPKCTYGRLVEGAYCDCRIGQELARLAAGV